MPEPSSQNRLTFIRKFSYGVGHVLNDLCASMWFTYLLIFYHKVLGMNNILAGSLLLIGQVADAVATPLVGYESDRINGFCGYGKRKSWHLIGSVCVAASFCFIFMTENLRDPMFYTVGNGSEFTTLLYYAPFIVIFQFGWASTQISHLSLIPSLTTCEHDKVGLNSIRYAFTVISNLAVYAVALYLLSTNHTGGKNVTPADYTTFRTLAFLVIGTGAVFSLIFHVGTKERPAEQDSALSTSVRTRMYVLCWLKTSQFYVVGLLYMCTRLIVNLSQVYLSMYLTETLELSKKYIAIVPLVVFICGFSVTFPMKFLTRKLGKKAVYFAGLLFVTAACIWFKFLRGNVYPDNYLVMVAGALNGIGGSTLLVLSLSLTADLIDQNTESAAFVYGAMSFADKLSNGIAIQMIQIAHPCKSSSCCAACAPFYGAIITYVPIGFAAIALIALLFIRRRRTEYTDVPEAERSPLNNGRPQLTYGSVFADADSQGSINADPGDRVVITKSATLPEPIHSSVDSERLFPGDQGGHYPSANNPSDSTHRPSFIVGSTPDRSFHSPR